MEKECCLYRHFDKDKNLLYVGISLSVVSRLKQHYQKSGWAENISIVTVEKFPSREEALRAEAKAIQSENPRFNIQGRKRITKANRYAAAMSMIERERKLKIKIYKFFDNNGNFRPGAEIKWNKLKAYASTNRSYSFRERIKKVEEKARRTLEFIESYNTDYPPEDGIPRSVNVYF